jgi:hypothetical protein
MDRGFSITALDAAARRWNWRRLLGTMEFSD